jgi:hypothetical protein
MLGDSHRALYFYEQRMFIASETEDRSGAAVDSWNLGKQLVQWGDLQRATELMQICVDYERASGHSDAEKHAAYLEQVQQELGALQDPPTADAPDEG